MLPNLHHLSASGNRSGTTLYRCNHNSSRADKEDLDETLSKKPQESSQSSQQSPSPPPTPVPSLAFPSLDSSDELDSSLAGIVLFFVAERRALPPVLFVQELLSLATAPRTGVGLMHAMLQHPAQTACPEEVQLIVCLDNVVAIAFYRRLGFDNLVEAGQCAFEPLRGIEMCMAARRVVVEKAVAALYAPSALTYTTHQHKAAFVMQDMRRFKEVTAALQAARLARGSSSSGGRLLPNDTRVRYVVATTIHHSKCGRGAI